MRVNFYFMSAVALSVSMVGCSTYGMKSDSKTASTSETNRKVASAAGIEYTTDTRELPKVCGRAPNADVSVDKNQYVLTSRKESVTNYIVKTPVYDCESTSGDGKSGDWKGFYDRSGDKARMLASAIKGVGERTAPYLVPAFQAGKPRSWYEFADLIRSSAAQMERQHGINASWANNVLKQYKAENIRNLGYLAVAACNIVSWNEERYEEREYLGDYSVVVEARIRGGKLLPNECEGYSISWNGREVTGAASSDSNAYSITTNYDNLTSDNVNSGRKAIVTFKGQRRAVAPAYFIEIPGSSAIAGGGSVIVTVQNSKLAEAMQVPEFANNCKLSASIVISGRKGSAWGSKKSAPVKSATFALDGTRNSTSYTATGVSLADGQHPVVTIGTSFAAGCPFYNTSRIDNGTIEE